MKNVFYFMLLVPFLVTSQNTEAYTVIENVMLTPDPAKITEFEAGMAAHNKKYHAEGTYGARVYWISNGKNAGKYMWNMGPLPWSAMDTRPAQDGHDADWNTNVTAHALADGDVNYWRFHPEFSNFSKDFTLKNLFVFVIDIKRFKSMDFINILKKVQKVYEEKRPDQLYGGYMNEMANMDGQDFAWVEFFDKSAWMGKEDKFPQDFEEVHGAGSFAKFLTELEDATHGEKQELWIFREDLSGLGGEIQAASRQ